jgi:hypothetical protein
MATRYDRNRQQWITEFEQTGIRVYRRHPPGIGKPQAEAWEVKRRREIYDRVDLDRKPDLTIGDAIDLWLQDNRRKNQKQALSEAKQWEPWRGRLLKDAPEVAAGAAREGVARTYRGWCPTHGATRGWSCDACQIEHHQSPADDAKSRLQSDVASEAHTGEPERADTDAAGAAAQGCVSNTEQVALIASRAPSPECQSAIWLLAYTGLRASELLALADKLAFAIGHYYGGAEQDREAAYSSGAYASAFTLMGAAIGALLLGIAQAIYRG